MNRFLGLGAALVVLAAFDPPRWVQRQWGIRAFHEAATAPLPPAAVPAPR